METKNSKMFEKLIKDSFENHEVEFDPKDWPVFEKKFDKVLKNKLFNKFKYASIGTIIIAAIVAISFINSNTVVNSDNSIKQNQNKVLKQSNETKIIENQNLTLNDDKTIKAIKKNISAKNKKSYSESVFSEKREAVNVPVTDKINKKDDDRTSVKEAKLQKQENKLTNNSKKIVQVLTIDVNKMIVCADEDIAFFPSINKQSCEYNWNFGDGSTSSKVNPVHTYKEAGSFDVKLTVRDNKIDTAFNASVSILVNSKPEAMFDFEIVKEGLAYPQVRFTDKSAEALYWEWNFGDEKISYEQNPTHAYFINSDKKINVSLSAMNVQGCKSKIEKTITFNNIFDLMAPNAFSPDGDGLNDYFMPKALEVYDIPFEMFIYDRAGTLIYNTKTKSKPWDGRISQTGLPETGTFIWIVILKDNNGNDIKYAGTVSIIK